MDCGVKARQERRAGRQSARELRCRSLTRWLDTSAASIKSVSSAMTLSLPSSVSAWITLYCGFFSQCWWEHRINKIRMRLMPTLKCFSSSHTHGKWTRSFSRVQNCPLVVWFLSKKYRCVYLFWVKCVNSFSRALYRGAKCYLDKSKAFFTLSKFHSGHLLCTLLCINISVNCCYE